ncbi:induced myeloid leukemia cell differentiation protein Mcl-1 homolog [Syngnathoides biaculeatus]|uniref:induced myeloid leukemia cell differentiation protein Mcl-1 homolog n=1 Tax=Syngnathoides biaculeatus TaxID=300417 RepID=UPI002ADDF288|nr:induced myeloid leukemia cell differentiation protein Mcl-1 homolog [Syngnathoides biaculeatus]
MMPTQRHLLRPNSNLGIATTLMLRPNPVPEGVFGLPQPAVAPAVKPEMQPRLAGIINREALDRRGDDMAFVSNVARLEFADGATNWGRVASLLAFAAVLSQALKEMRREGCVALVAQEVSTYLLSHQRTWLVQHNAWNGFAEFFEENDVESRMRIVLAAFGGLACILASVLSLLR